MNKPPPSVIFFSHSKKDEAKALAILAHLRQNGYPDECLFFDSDRQSGITPGKKWEKFLYEKLQNTACLLVFGTDNWSKSQWCLAEAFIAKNTERTILPLDFDGTVQSSIVGDIQSIRGFREDSKERLNTLVVNLRDLGLAPPHGEQDVRGWETHAIRKETFDVAAKQFRETLPWYWRLVPLAVCLTLIIVGILAIVLLVAPGVQSYLEQRNKLAEFASCPDSSLSETGSMQVSDLQDWLDDAKSREKRITIRCVLTERQHEFARDGRTIEIQAEGFLARLYFKNDEWWPGDTSFSGGARTAITGKVTSGDAVASGESVIDLGDTSLDLFSVKTITLKECVLNPRCLVGP